MTKEKPKPESMVEKAQELLDFSLELSKMHLARLREKSRSVEGLTPHEGNAVCTYVKTFSQITKQEYDREEKATKNVATLSDAELRAELAKLLPQSEEVSNED